MRIIILCVRWLQGGGLLLVECWIQRSSFQPQWRRTLWNSLQLISRMAWGLVSAPCVQGVKRRQWCSTRELLWPVCVKWICESVLLLLLKASLVRCAFGTCVVSMHCCAWKQRGRLKGWWWHFRIIQSDWWKTSYYSLVLAHLTLIPTSALYCCSFTRIKL